LNYSARQPDSFVGRRLGYVRLVFALSSVEPSELKSRTTIVAPRTSRTSQNIFCMHANIKLDYNGAKCEVSKIESVGKMYVFDETKHYLPFIVNAT
jgi:hypothetical protein